jgi:ribosomal peptide maturation radical SAM protein 1
MTDVVLVVVPYLSVQRPSIATGVLKASLIDAGIPASVEYLNLKFADTIGIDRYWFVSTYCQMDLLGEWTFSGKAFPELKTNEAEYMHEAFRFISVSCTSDELELYLKGRQFDEFFYELRSEASLFIDQEAERIVNLGPRIVGCSSTFQEHCSSLALLRRIRELAPEVITMLGGANCTDTIGEITHRKFLWVDYVVSGEADELLPVLCKNIFAKGRQCEAVDIPDGVYAPIHRNSDDVSRRQIRNAVVDDLDKSPVPDYREYFDTLNSLGIRDCIHESLVIETSRGCWWGQKKQCTFCGLNGSTMTYRAKSPERVIGELRYLSERYGLRNFLAVDCILNRDYFKSVFPVLLRSDEKYSIVYETKASLSRREVKMLSDAGVKCIQPGIESFHNEILSRLHKGSRIWTNIELLKWTLEFGIDTVWLLLYSLPDDEDDWYREIAEIIPLITHLQPPIKMNKIFYSKHSVYCKNPESYGLELAPSPCYEYVYPLSKNEIREYAYFFVSQTSFASPLAEKGKNGLHAFMKSVGMWVQLWSEFKRGNTVESVLLRMEIHNDKITIVDTRPCSVEQYMTLTGLDAEIYALCDKASTQNRIKKELEKAGRVSVSLDTIAGSLERLQSKRILLKMDDRFLSLAIRKSDYTISWNFSGGELYWGKLYNEFLNGRIVRNEPDAVDVTLQQMFGRPRENEPIDKERIRKQLQQIA